MSDGKDGNFILPPPQFKEEVKKSLSKYNRHHQPHFSTPNGMLLSRDRQPPPMYGPRGSTIPSQHMGASWKRLASPGRSEPSGKKYRPFLQDGPYMQVPPFADGKSDQNYRRPRPNNGPTNNRLDKDVIPGLLHLDWKLWCEGCDVNCRNEEEYQSHLTNHTPCSISGCKFVGHPMIMNKHRRLAHNEECSKKVGSGPSLEEIEQWKEERRKRYPTKINIVLRQQAQEERLKRGERIAENKDRFANRNGANCSSRENTGRNEVVSHLPKRQKRRNRKNGPMKIATLVESNDRIPFMGTVLLKNYKVQTKNALNMLEEYGTDSETDEREMPEVELLDEKGLDKIEQQRENCETLSEGEIVEDLKLPVESPVCTAPCTTFNQIMKDEMHVDTIEDRKESSMQKDSNKAAKLETAKKIELGIESEKGLKHENSKPSNVLQHKPQIKHHIRDMRVQAEKKYMLDYSKLRRTNQNTMLEKLLDSDIRHERNVMLQCVRYVLLKNFFGIIKPKESDTDSTSSAEKIKV